MPLNPNIGPNGPQQHGFITPNIVPGGPIGYIDANTPTSVTTISANERGPFGDSAILAIVTQITLGEVEFSVPTGFWGPFDDDDGII